MKKNKTLLVVIILIILILLSLGIIFIINKQEASDENIAQMDETSEIEVEQGEKVSWEEERMEFYIPKDWSFSFTQDTTLSGIDITGEDIKLELRYLPVDEDYLWSQQNNVIYENSSSRLYTEEGKYIASLNLAIELTEENYETGETSIQNYALFMSILRGEKGAEELTPEEMASIKYILDEFDN